MNNKGSGFILVLTVMLISSSVLIISLVVNRVNAFRRMGRLWSDMQKAEMIAVGGIEIAISQLAPLGSDSKEEPQQPSDGKDEKKLGKEESTKQQQKKQEEKSKALLNVLLNVVNKWQTFQLRESTEGIDGECKIYVSSEEGKINLNALYDAEKKKFVAQGTINAKQLCDFISERLKPLLEQKKEKAIELASSIEKFFKEHKALDDISQLFTFSESHGVHLFVQPQDTGIALTDLFTVYTTKNTMEPLLFSALLCRILGLKRAEDLKKVDPKSLFTLSQENNIDWQKSWNPPMTALYGKDYVALPPEIKPFFMARFGPMVWSVVSYGKVGLVTAKVCAIIEKSKNASEPFHIRKLYWL